MVSLANTTIWDEVHEFQEIATAEHRTDSHDAGLHSLLDRKLRVMEMELALLGTCKVDVMAPDLMRFLAKR